MNISEIMAALEAKHPGERNIFQPLKSLDRRLGIDSRAKLGGVYAVEIEHGLDLILTKPFKLAGCDIVEIDKRHPLGLSHLPGPKAECMVHSCHHSAVLVIPCATRGQ